MNSIFVIGAGAWGTALALASFRAGLQTKIWSISSQEVQAINDRHENGERLPGIKIPTEIQATTNESDVSAYEGIIIVPPAQFMRSVCETFHKKINSNIPLIIASKGIEQETSYLMAQVVQEFFPENPLFVLSGPSFAKDVAKSLPTAMTLAGSSFNQTHQMAMKLSSSHFKLYPSEDLIGVQIGGACKNIIAIASGIVDGLELGDNARAAIVTYGLAEIARLGCAMGARYETFLGLSGIGDLMLTSLNSQSRNQTFGLAVGQSIPLENLMADKSTLVEGVHTVLGTLVLAKKHEVDMPITVALHHLLSQSTSLEEFVNAVFSDHLNMEV